MSKHTPGPWGFTVQKNNSFDLFASGAVIACGIRMRNLEADARLIAAAPEMYAALEQIERMGYADFGDRLMVEAALKKARGE